MPTARVPSAVDPSAARALLAAALRDLGLADAYRSGKLADASRRALLDALIARGEARVRELAEGLVGELAGTAGMAGETGPDAGGSTVPATYRAESIPLGGRSDDPGDGPAVIIADPVDFDGPAGGPATFALPAAVRRWRDATAGHLRSLYLAGAIAVLGPADLTAADRRALGRATAAQVEYLDGFAGQVADGSQAPGGMAARAALYAHAAWGVAQAVGRARREGGDGDERRVLSSSEHCITCVEQAGLGWQPVGTLNGIGDSECKSRCKCYFEYRDAAGSDDGGFAMSAIDRADLVATGPVAFGGLIAADSVDFAARGKLPPGGRWVTIEHRPVYIRGGKVLAGAGATPGHPKSVAQVTHEAGAKGDGASLAPARVSDEKGAGAGGTSEAKKGEGGGKAGDARESSSSSETYGPSKARVRHLDYESEEIEAAAREVFGRKVTPQEIASAVGAPHDAVVDIATGDGIRVSIKGPGYDAERTISRTVRGELVIDNDHLNVDPSHQGKGLGTSIFGRQVEQAEKLGVSRIRTTAGAGEGYNGYYTWPRLGYDGPIPGDVGRKLPAKLRGAEQVSDLMKTPEGRAWWKANGDSVVVSFDLKPGSLSRRVFDAYQAEKAGGKSAKLSRDVVPGERLLDRVVGFARRAVGRDAGRAANRATRGDFPDFTADELEILDRIWDRIGERGGRGGEGDRGDKAGGGGEKAEMSGGTVRTPTVDFDAAGAVGMLAPTSFASKGKPPAGGHWVTHEGRHLFIRGAGAGGGHGGDGGHAGGHAGGALPGARDVVADVHSAVAEARASSGLDLRVEHGPPRGPAEGKFVEKAHAAGKVAVVAEYSPKVHVESVGDSTRYHVGGSLTREVRPARHDDPDFVPRGQVVVTSRGQRGEVDFESYHKARDAAEATARRSVDRIAADEAKLHSGRNAERLAVRDPARHDWVDAAYVDPHWTTTFRVLTPGN